MMEEHEIRNLRNHPTYMLESSWGALLILFMMFVNGAGSWVDLIKDITSGGSKNLLVAVGIFGGVVVFFLIALFFSFRRWRKTTLTIADGSLTWEQNTIFSKRNEYSISTISNVNLEQNLFERIVGTYKLKLDTSSISTANQTDMKIILGKKDAFAVRDLIIFYMKHPEGIVPKEDGAGEPSDEANENGVLSSSQSQHEVKSTASIKSDALDYYSPISDDGEEYDLLITPGENFVCALAGVKESQLFWLIAIIVGLIALFVFGVTHGQSLSGFFASAVVLLSFVYSIGKSLVTSFLRTYNFKVRREEEHILVTSGAIKIRSYSVPVKQIQAVRFQSTLLGRLMGRVSVSVINVSGEGEDVDGQWIFPPIAKEKIPELMQTVLPEIPLANSEEMMPRPKRALTKSIIWTDVVMGILAILGIAAYNLLPDEFYQELEIVSKSSFGVILAIVLIGIFTYWIAVDVVRQQTEKILIQKDCVAFRSGALSWQQIEVPYENIQMLRTIEGPLNRLLKLKKGRISLLAATVASQQIIPEFDTKELEQLQEAYRKTIF